MKKLSAFLAASLCSAAVFAQCTPSPLAYLTIVSPLPTNALPDGFVGTAYQGSGLSVSFVASGQAIDPGTLPIPLPLPVQIPPGLATVSITRVEVVDVTGLPPGMTRACNNGSCSWSVGAMGCILLSGTPTQAGDYTITFSTNLEGTYTSPIQSGNFTSPAPVPVRYDMKVRNDLSIAEFSASGFSLYPNPAGDMFTVAYPATESNLATIDVTDMSGKTVASFSKNIDSYGGNVSFDISNLSNGLYRVLFSAGSVRSASKLVVQK